MQASRYKCIIENYFSYFWTKIYIVGTQKKHILYEHSKQICFQFIYI